MTDERSAFPCPACGFVSHNPNDAKHRYCVRCHRFFDDVPGYWMHDDRRMSDGLHLDIRVCRPWPLGKGRRNMPGYWMHETSGILRPAIMAYLNGDELNEAQFAVMRVYLRQWINAPVWLNVDELRNGIDALTSREAIEAWLDHAIDAGIDPL